MRGDVRGGMSCMVRCGDVAGGGKLGSRPLGSMVVIKIAVVATQRGVRPWQAF